MEMTTVVSSVKEKVAALTTTGSSLGDSEGLRKWSLRSERWVKDSERRLASRRRNSKRRLAGEARQVWLLQPDCGCENRPAETNGGFGGCDDQFDFHPKGAREALKGAKPGNDMIGFVILRDHSLWRTDWQQESGSTKDG